MPVFNMLIHQGYVTSLATASNTNNAVITRIYKETGVHIRNDVNDAASTLWHRTGRQLWGTPTIIINAALSTVTLGRSVFKILTENCN